MNLFRRNSKSIFLIAFIILSFNNADSMSPGKSPLRRAVATTGLQIVRALYGDLTLQAGVSDVTAALQSRVVNNQLTLPAQSKVTWLGDPAPERAKSLLIIFKIGNNVYLKLIADAAGDTISLQTASSAMLLMGQSQQLQRPQQVRQQKPLQPMHQPMRQSQAVQPVQAAVSQQQAQGVPDMTSMLAGTGASAVSPETVRQQQYAPQQNQLTTLQQRRLEQFRR